MVGLDGAAPRHLDRDVARLLRPGADVRKDAWSGTLRVDGRPHHVGLSRDARAFLALSPVLVIVLGGLGAVALRRTR